jgi:hypothetical protein
MEEKRMFSNEEWFKNNLNFLKRSPFYKDAYYTPGVMEVIVILIQVVDHLSSEIDEIKKCKGTGE